jgi:hypothetical protein
MMTYHKLKWPERTVSRYKIFVEPQIMLVFVCLFSWRYNPLWLYFHSPVAGFSLLVFEVS